MINIKKIQLTHMGVAKIILWGGHRLGGLLAPCYLNFSDEDSASLTIFFTHLCALFLVICLLSYGMRIM